ncbi:cytochrome P450 [Coprinopsis marcescibilis]|uniref:Cytochrome P450 n=1 Tax=Coprinopsis marcescibilis TaxID=230819 RepID=A0A5C3KNE5_COPMA|nr:cytochrome P450 [Coprinopsis marcescibilis]
MAGRMPTKEPWKTYASWSRTYESPIISFRVYNTTLIVLSSVQAIQDMLERRQDIYSERPRNTMYNDICGRGKTIFNVDASSTRHKMYRKMLGKGLGPRGGRAGNGAKVIRGYTPLIEREARRLAESLISMSRGHGEGIVDDFIPLVQRSAVAVILGIAFGYTVQGDSDPFIKVSEEASKISGYAMAPGRWMVDYVPLLRYVPAWMLGAGWKRQGLIWRERLHHLADVPHLWAKNQIETGNYEESFTSRLLRPDPETGVDGVQVGPEQEELVKWCAGGLYAGASDTTVSAIVSFILLMALYPEVQCRAREEVLAHLPAGDDDDSTDLAFIHRLPYLNAVMQEVLRYAPVGNLALPHRVSQEDEYGGLRIPQNATVIANVWAIFHNETLYPNPHSFWPERFLGSNAESNAASIKSSVPQPDPRRWAFGFGKRVCPGMYFAETTMLYAFFHILATCEMSLPPSLSARPEVEFTTGITSHIKPFPVVVQPLRKFR